MYIGCAQFLLKLGLLDGYFIFINTNICNPGWIVAFIPFYLKLRNDIFNFLISLRLTLQPQPMQHFF